MPYKWPMLMATIRKLWCLLTSLSFHQHGRLMVQSLAYVSFEKKKPIVFVQSLTSGNRNMVANFKGNNSAPAWSPDGSKLAIVLTYGANSQIYTIDANGGGLKQVTKSNRD